MRKSVYFIFLSVVALLSMSACNALDLTPEKKSSEDVQYPAAVEETAVEAEPTETSGALVKAVRATIGTIVTTGQGLPLYRWDRDSANRSTCYDTCAQQFTAYPYTEDLAFEGVDRKNVGKVQRKDGTWQLTLNKQPVYTNVNDEAGTWKAQGQNGTWWLATPTGGKLTTKK